jgi:hypothetical protein
MRNRLAAVVLLALATVVPAPAAAQDAPPPPAVPVGSLPIGLGARVRVTPVGSEALQGLLAGAGPRGLTLALPTDDPFAPVQRLEFPLESLQRVEISTGKKHHLWLGALIGAVALGALGLTTDVEPDDCEGTNDAFCSRGEAVAYMALTGALVGGTVGFFVKRDRWVPVAIDALGAPPPAGAAPEPPGLSAGVTLRF